MTRDRNKKTLDAAAEMLGSEVLAIQAGCHGGSTTGPRPRFNR